MSRPDGNESTFHSSKDRAVSDGVDASPSIIYGRNGLSPDVDPRKHPVKDATVSIYCSGGRKFSHEVRTKRIAPESAVNARPAVAIVALDFALGLRQTHDTTSSRQAYLMNKVILRTGARLLLVGVAVVPLVSCGEKITSGNQTRSVAVRDNEFSPQQIRIERGTTLRWLNEGSVVHDVTAYEGAFRSDLDPGQTFEHLFSESGTFGYACGRHSGMQGSVIVE